MNIALYGVCSLFSYLFCGMNPAIILARVLYGEDIRKVGSHNPGFTNFKRTYGGKYAWCVLVLDLLKAVLCCLICFHPGMRAARRCSSRAFCHAWPLLSYMVPFSRRQSFFGCHGSTLVCRLARRPYGNLCVGAAVFYVALYVCGNFDGYASWYAIITLVRYRPCSSVSALYVCVPAFDMAA